MFIFFDVVVGSFCCYFPIMLCTYLGSLILDDFLCGVTVSWYVVGTSVDWVMLSLVSC